MARLLPSARSLLVAFALAACGGGAYAVARSTSVFHVRTIEVRGAPAPVAREVRAALADVRGASLLTLRGARVERLARTVPQVAIASYDRAFPNTLVVFVRRERPVAVLRRGAASWLVSPGGRVLARLPRRARLDLPRIWVRRGVGVALGAPIAEPQALRALRVLGPTSGPAFAPRVRGVRAGPRELTLELATGTELRLGNEADLALKLAVAERIVVGGGATGAAYLDVSVPERPVSSTNPQPEG